MSTPNRVGIDQHHHQNRRVATFSTPARLAPLVERGLGRTGNAPLSRGVHLENRASGTAIDPMPLTCTPPCGIDRAKRSFFQDHVSYLNHYNANNKKVVLDSNDTIFGSGFSPPNYRNKRFFVACTSNGFIAVWDIKPSYLPSENPEPRPLAPLIRSESRLLGLCDNDIVSAAYLRMLLSTVDYLEVFVCAIKYYTTSNLSKQAVVNPTSSWCAAILVS